MTRGYFVTGTDTGIGKTYSTAALVRAARTRGVRVLATKPVASGCIATASGLRSEDAQALIDAMGPDAPPYAEVNPLALRAPLSPHIAARLEGVAVSIDALVAAQRATVEAARARGTLDDAGLVLVEGVGGWCVPITDDAMQSELARRLALPVLLIVGVRLGCINHALLTARAIASDGFRLAGWIANRVDPSLQAADDAIATIAAQLGDPLAVLAPNGGFDPGVVDFLTR